MRGQLGHFEIPAADDERAKAFWGSLFGWQFRDAMPEFHYHMFEGEPGGAIYPAEEGAAKGLIVYFISEDIDADLARVRELGGKADDKLPIPGIGWFARAHDTEGNAFSLFQGDESVPHQES